MKKIIQRIIGIMLCVITCANLASDTVRAEMTVEEHGISAINTETLQELAIDVINYAGGAYILPETAATLAEMDYIMQDGESVFQRGSHEVMYDGQQVEYKGQNYIRMENALEQLSCAYVYSSEQEALYYSPTESFVENLFLDCNEILHGTAEFDLTWVSDVDCIWATELYDILGEWGFGKKRERMEETLWEIMVPNEVESELLSAVAKGNKTIKTVSSIAKYAGEAFGGNLVLDLLGSKADGVMKTYNKLNKLIPGLSISDYISLLESAYNAQHASNLYINSVKYGLYKNPAIENSNLYAATQNVYRRFEENQSSVDSFLEEMAQSLAEGGMDRLLEDAIEEGLLYQDWTVKLFKMFTDEFLGMEKNAGAVLALMDCAEIQKEALQQYQDSYSIITPEYNDCDPLQMKYSVILYLRACQYGYEKYGTTGETGAWCEEIMSPLIGEKLQLLAAYSDEELTQTVENENLDFGLFSDRKKEDTVGGSGIPSENQKEVIYAVDVLGLYKDEVIALAGEPEWRVSRNSGNYLGYDNHLALIGFYDEEQGIWQENQEYNRIYEMSFGVNQGNPKEYSIGRFQVAEGLFSDMTYEELLNAAKQQGYFVWENISESEYTSAGLNVYSEEWAVYFRWSNSYYDMNARQTILADIELETAAPTRISIFEVEKPGEQLCAVDFLGKNPAYLVSCFGDTLYHWEYVGGDWFMQGEFTEDDMDFGNITNPYWVFDVSQMWDNYYYFMLSNSLKEESIITKIYPGKEVLFPLAEGIYADMTADDLKAAADRNGFEYVEDETPQNDRKALKYVYILGPGWEITYKLYEDKTLVVVGRR